MSVREKLEPIVYGGDHSARSVRAIGAFAGLAVSVGLLLASHLVNAQPLTAVGPLVPLARLADLLLLLGVLLLATALGAALLERCSVWSPGIEGAALACALGLGCIAYLLLALGLLGLYRPVSIFILILVLTLLVRRRLRVVLGALARSVGQVPSLVRATRGQRTVVWLGLLLGGGAVLALLGALTPPHHYDPLTYHLALPKRFLETGQVGPVPDIVGSDLPLTIELLYGIGLAWGSDAFAQLLHFAFAGLTAVLLWGATRRWFDRVTSWLAVVLFLGTPLVFVWARVADNDLAVGCFLLLALIATLRASDVGDVAVARRWLVLGGLFAGLALSVKYQTAPALVPLGLWAMMLPWRDGLTPFWSRARWWQGFSGAAIFTVVALAVAAPWYLHNLTYLLALAQALVNVGTAQQTPGGPEPDLGTYILHGLSISARTPLGYALLPIQAFIRGDLEQRFVVPNPLFLLLPAIIVLPKWRRDRTVLLALAMAGAYGIVWALGVQELRYLLAIFPLLAVGTAGVLRAAWNHTFLRPWVRGGLLLSACLTLLLTFLHVGADRPLAVTFGLESRDAYLRQSITVGATYRAVSFLGANTPADEQALFVNEVQVYYLPAGLRVQAVDSRSTMYTLMERYATPRDAVAALQEQRIRYLLVNDADLRWWMQADSTGRILRARANFGQITDLLEPVYQEGMVDRPNMTIYRVPDRPGVSVKVK